MNLAHDYSTNVIKNKRYFPTLKKGSELSLSFSPDVYIVFLTLLFLFSESVSIQLLTIDKNKIPRSIEQQIYITLKKKKSKQHNRQTDCLSSLYSGKQCGKGLESVASFYPDTVKACSLVVLHFLYKWENQKSPRLSIFEKKNQE